MKFEEQAKDIKVLKVNQPRTYLKWTNTEEGLDKQESWERIEIGYVVYINDYNRSSSVIKGDRFFDTLEKMFHGCENIDIV